MYLQEAKEILKNTVKIAKPLMSKSNKNVVDLAQGGTNGKLIKQKLNRLKRKQ